jgi:nucleoid DNA-binding protein
VIRAGQLVADRRRTCASGAQGSAAPKAVPFFKTGKELRNRVDRKPSRT